MLTHEEFTALMDILQRHVQGRLTTAEAFGLNMILAKLAPPQVAGTAQPSAPTNGVAHEVAR